MLPELAEDQLSPERDSAFGAVPSPEQAYETLSRLATLRATRLPIPKTPRFSRGEVVHAFASAFELIGGTTRLALWANENPGEFYKLFGKLLPATSIAELTVRTDKTDARQLTTEELEEIVRNRLMSEKVVELDEYRPVGEANYDEYRDA